MVKESDIIVAARSHLRQRHARHFQREEHEQRERETPQLR